MTTPRPYRLRTASNFSRRYIIASGIYIAASAAALALLVFAPQIVAAILERLP